MKQILLIICILLSINSFGQSTSSDSVLINNQTFVSIKSCKAFMNLLVGEQLKPTEICSCLFSKLFEDFQTDSIYIKMLSEDNFSMIYELADVSVSEHMASCITQILKDDSVAKVVFTPLMEKGLRLTFAAMLQGANLYEITDIDKYCNCMIEQLQVEFTAKEYFTANPTETVKYKKIEKECMKKSEIKK